MAIIDFNQLENLKTKLDDLVNTLPEVGSPELNTIHASLELLGTFNLLEDPRTKLSEYVTGFSDALNNVDLTPNGIATLLDLDADDSDTLKDILVGIQTTSQVAEQIAQIGNENANNSVRNFLDGDAVSGVRDFLRVSSEFNDFKEEFRSSLSKVASRIRG